MPTVMYRYRCRNLPDTKMLSDGGCDTRRWWAKKMADGRAKFDEPACFECLDCLGPIPLATPEPVEVATPEPVEVATPEASGASRGRESTDPPDRRTPPPRVSARRERPSRPRKAPEAKDAPDMDPKPKPAQVTLIQRVANLVGDRAEKIRQARAGGKPHQVRKAVAEVAELTEILDQMIGRETCR